MKQFESHHLMTIDEVKKYSIEVLKLFQPDENLLCEEIGDGNINYIFRIWNPITKKSIILKQADKYLRSSGRMLDLNRSKIEFEVLRIQGDCTRKYIPQLYAYDDEMCVIAMEDISAYHNLRNELLQHHIYSSFTEDITEFMTTVLLKTSDLVCESSEKKRRVHKFLNTDLCKISEDLVFTEPYNNYLNRNIVPDELLSYIENNFYHNKPLIYEVSKLRYQFMNHAQSLLHGDLHSGSIFINETGLKIIDPEFAFYGPMGYDIGNVMGSLIFPFITDEVNKTNHLEFKQWLLKSIPEIFDKSRNKLIQKYDSLVSLNMYQSSEFRDYTIAGVMTDTLGYAGTEIIRRTIGDTKVKELYDIKDHRQLILVEKILLAIGKDLIMNRYRIQNGPGIIELILSNVKNEIENLERKL